MANDTNSFHVEGNLVDAVSVRELNNGQMVVNGTVANNQFSRDESEESGWRKFAHYFHFAAWNGIAKRMKDLGKGSRILISGKLRQERWETDEGHKRSIIRLHVESVSIIDAR